MPFPKAMPKYPSISVETTKEIDVPSIFHEIITGVSIASN
jgi:hypothetical protein